MEADDASVAPRRKAVRRQACASHPRRAQLAASTRSPSRWALKRRWARGLALEPPTTPGRRVNKRDRQRTKHLCGGREEAAGPPTKHARAPAIRLRPVCRKVTTGFRADGGRDLLAAVRAHVNPGHRQGVSPLQAMQHALSPTGALLDPG